MGSRFPSEDPPAIRFDGVSFSYRRLPAVEDVSFAIERGELGYLLGPTAAGKTTLLKLAHGQLKAQRGSVLVDGQELRKARTRGLRRLRQRVGFIFQDFRLMERLTAIENVAYALRVRDLSLPRREAGKRAAEALKTAGLGHRAGAFPYQLSAGQQQRLAVARALAARPTILLADEPTASLDEGDATTVLSLLHEAAEQGTTVLIATHHPDLVTGSRRRVIRLKEGKVIWQGVLRGPAWAAV